MLVRQPDERAPRQRTGGFSDSGHQALLGSEMIVLVGLDGLAGVGFGAQVEAIAQCLEHALFEHAQFGLQGSALAQILERRVIGIEQQRQRIMPGGELQE